MQQQSDITEREAYEAYLEHLRPRRCECRPAVGVLCPEGVRLHGLWRAAAEGESP